MGRGDRTTALARSGNGQGARFRCRRSRLEGHRAAISGVRSCAGGAPRGGAGDGARPRWARRPRWRRGAPPPRHRMKQWEQSPAGRRPAVLWRRWSSGRSSASGAGGARGRAAAGGQEVGRLEELAARLRVAAAGWLVGELLFTGLEAQALDSHGSAEQIAPEPLDARRISRGGSDCVVRREAGVTP